MSLICIPEIEIESYKENDILTSSVNVGGGWCGGIQVSVEVGT